MEMTITDWIQAISMIVLVIVTGIYAWRTHVMSKAAKEQAEASVKMTDTAKEQILSEARPYLLLRLTNEFTKWPPTNNEVNVTIRNEGKGPAINIEASLWHPKTIHPYDSKGYLALNEEWQVSLSTSDVGVPYEGEKEVRPFLPELKDIIKDYGAGVVTVRYHDIHKRNWLSYLSFEMVEADIPYVRDGEQNIVEWGKS